MRLADLKVGDWVAVPNPDVRNPVDRARGGINALPAQVMKIGKFRFSRATNCAPGEIVEDNFRMTIVVRVLHAYGTFPDDNERRAMLGGYYGATISMAAPGMPQGLPLKSKKLKWTTQIVEPGKISRPWDQFVREAEEWQFAVSEVAAFTERRNVLVQEIRDLLSDNGVEPTLISGTKTEVRVKENGELLIAWRQDCNYNVSKIAAPKRPTTDVAKRLAALEKELVDVIQRLECKVQ